MTARATPVGRSAQGRTVLDIPSRRPEALPLPAWEKSWRSARALGHSEGYRAGYVAGWRWGWVCGACAGVLLGMLAIWAAIELGRLTGAGA